MVRTTQDLEDLLAWLLDQSNVKSFLQNSWVTRNIFNMIDPQTLEGFEDEFPCRASYKQFQHQEVHLSSA